MDNKADVKNGTVLTDMFYPQLAVFGDTNIGIHNFGTDDSDNVDWQSEYVTISNGTELIAFSTRVNAGETTLNAILTADITMTDDDNAKFKPIGSLSNSFSGKFDGCNKTISNLTIKSVGTQGLFGTVNGGLIENVTLLDGSIKGSNWVGGIVGNFKGSTMRNCCNINTTVTGVTNVGGLCGNAGNSSSSTTIERCYNTGTINVLDKTVFGAKTINVGGLVGELYNTNLSESYNTGEITVTSIHDITKIGGIAGYARVNSSITDCYNTANVKCVDENGVAKGTGIGGIAGIINNNVTIQYCFSVGAVIGAENIGGVVGSIETNDTSCTVKNCYYNSEVCGYGAVNNVDIHDSETDVRGLPFENFVAGNLVGFDTENVWTIPTTEPLYAEPTADGNRIVTYYFPYLTNVGATSSSFGITEHNFNAQDPTALDNSALWSTFVEISNAAQLNAFAEKVNSGERGLCAVLTADIDMNGKTFAPIGNNDNIYIGKFDGCGHTISNLTIDDSLTDNHGLFGIISHALVMNVGLVDCEINGRNFVGGICAEARVSKILRCYVSGSVSGEKLNCGGICGFLNSESLIADCFADCTVSGSELVGGICGYINNSSLYYTVSTGTVTATGDGVVTVGGICGKYNENSVLNYNYYDKSLCTGLTAVGSVEDVSGVEDVGGVDDTENVKGLFTEEITGTQPSSDLAAQIENAPTRVSTWTFTKNVRADNVFSPTGNIATMNYPMLKVFAGTNEARAEADKITASTEITFHAEYNKPITATYGDTIDIGFELYYTIGDNTTEYPVSGTATLSCGSETLVSSQSVYDTASGKYNLFTYDTSGKKIPTTATPVTITYSGDELSNGSSADIAITLGKKAFDYTLTAEKIYDGNADIVTDYISVSDTDDCLARISFKLPSADVGNHTTFSDFAVALFNEDMGFYTMTADNLTINYDIKQRDIAEVSVAPIRTQTHTGKEVKPTVNVSLAEMGYTLVQGKDYTLSYANNIEAGENTATVTLTGIGNFSGTKSVNFTIKNLKPATLTGVSVTSKTYDGAAAAYTCNPSASYEGAAVTFDEYDYTWWKTDGTELSGAPVNAGSYLLEVFASNDDYFIDEMIEFEITKAPLTITAPSKTITAGEALPTLSDSELTFSGFVNGEDKSVLTLPTTALAYEQGASSIAGSYKIIASGITADNYAITFVDGTLTVNAGSGGGSGYNGGYIPTTPTSNEPYIKDKNGEKGWTAIEKQLEAVAEGGTVKVEMNGTTELPKNILEQIKGKDINVVLEMDNGIVWEINGKDVINAKNVDLGVKMNANTIPVKVINAITGETFTVQLSLNYDGEFGFTAKMTVSLGEKFDGLIANLMLYNPKTEQLDFVHSTEIKGGNGEFNFTHASDWAIIIDEVSYGETDADIDGGEDIDDDEDIADDDTTDDDTADTDDGDAPTDDDDALPDDISGVYTDDDVNPFTGVMLGGLGVVIVSGVAALLTAKKRRK